MSAPRTLPDPRSGEAGFTLLEMMIAVMLMVFILIALATVTAQWLPNWNHGMARMERDERFAFGINRMVEDLAVAEFVPANTAVKTPYFDGSELSVSFVRTAIGPSSRPGLEIVRFQEVADSSGPALVRLRTAFVPMDATAQVRLADPVVLIRSPYRVTFAYAGSDDTWQPTWRAAAELPRRVRITVRDDITQQRLAVSTAALLHIDTPAECAHAKNVDQCMKQIAQVIAQATAGDNPTPAAATAPR
jgi:general secretion pathway protein J